MMNFWQAFFLGALQGVTEFLPVSSSGHLALAQNWLGLQEPLLSFDIFLHGISLIAIIIFFFKEIKKLNFQKLVFMGVGTIPAVFVGLFLKDTLESIFYLPIFIGIALIITGINNLISNNFLQNKDRKTTPLTIKKSFIIGIFQSFALIPGLSRSGTTLLGSLGQKLDKQQAFTFTFLLAIPAILGALLLQSIDLIQGGLSMPHWTLFVAGGTSTLITSLASLNLFKKLIEKSQFRFFGIYALIIGVGVVISQLLFT
ncbi:MAG: undecaprenyl-diphosphate phosphatase [Candidatus Pacebacteria bacterium]|jgi:undecaprenyl-diphosphatase|nr:undecaprenyl-diphosphate phosphatase [Candidatus Paceibacterota bacterium]MBT4652121.1 undecaprenyl-diphosphate phosphatase [Candidatus Paceibacterota bacterium]MBT6756552.1 undecaprenyl-diphosphate phosphatase [Candidatus Paceibacterota bacterium]MBT6921377.1 undecaprenyl-diphosphate phosphatase [Candidatus Paceibacterota bacterium]